MASNADKLTATFNSTNPNVARVSADRTSGATTLVADNLAGWPTVSKVHFSTYQLDTQDNLVPGSQRDWSGIVSGTNISNLVLKAGGADNGNFINDVIEMNPTGSWGQDLYEWGSKEHDLQGNHTNITPNQVSTDTILEKTSGNGVNVDGLSIKDSKLNSDNSVIPSNLSAGTGSTWAWQTWTPTFTNFTLGNGTINTARYSQTGKKVDFRLRITLGSTSAVGTDTKFSLPVTASTEESSGTTPFNIIGGGILYDAGTANYLAYTGMDSTTTAWIMRSVGGTQIAGLQAAQPFTWTTGDVIYVRGTYEAA